ncbi:MAG: hypothetical protein KAQ74_03595, partial [Dehalococcoidia bacterium]|nr:hypothetical protein [Dehalococcoidia bacterium]
MERYMSLIVTSGGATPLRKNRFRPDDPELSAVLPLHKVRERGLESQWPVRPFGMAITPWHCGLLARM